ncbi:hypothetical protein NV379_17840 [Paenibacillus sp. N1-5-1-14]|uniref:hypothetical protein n=1 Tax=Paenibacillus radicibacter TaxID=2972488 RepID=UPI0021598C4C|nr:hypothetical protein [Paenibacillus radicibacter]MCR8644520.1 hypothetical protein [Paenibacillus radicibacter]
MDQSLVKEQLDQLTEFFFQLFTNKEGAIPQVNLIHELFIPSGTIICNTGSTPIIYTLEEFIKPRVIILTDGTLVDFEEKEISEQTEIFGQIAHRFSVYEKSGVRDGQYFQMKGSKSTQFIHTPDGWKICSLIWDDEK